MMQNFDLDIALLTFGDSSLKSSWTVREAVEGTQIFGGIGSGKTSGSGRLIAKKFLAHGFGGLVLTAKPDEKDLWLQYCRDTNRTQDLIIVEPGGHNAFDFMEYESSIKAGGKHITENIVQVLKTVIRAGEEKAGGKHDDQFWETALDMVMFHAIELCMMAYGKVTIPMLYDIVTSLPKNSVKTQDGAQQTGAATTAYKKAFRKAQDNVRQQYDLFKAFLSPEEVELLENDDPGFVHDHFFHAVPDASEILKLDDFFNVTYKNLGEKTRSIVDFIFMGFLFRLLREPVYSLFCNRPTSFTPEDSLDGKIILLHLPVKIYDKVGRDIQVMFKYIWQRAMERRNVYENGRPVFLFADEAQHFIHEHDAEYQATARSSRIATVYISQNMANYYANMGGEKSEHRVKSFLGTLGTKIFHGNADVDTNKYASELFGQGYRDRLSRASSYGPEPSFSETLNPQLEKLVPPEVFPTLKNGGPLNSFRVAGYMHRQGRRFSHGGNFTRIIFHQNS